MQIGHDKVAPNSTPLKLARQAASEMKQQQFAQKHAGLINQYVQHRFSGMVPGTYDKVIEEIIADHPHLANELRG